MKSILIFFSIYQAKLEVQNAPAWCDRVLWHANASVTVEPVTYGGVKELQTSDHRVIALILLLFY